jgi:hypothetical protein
VETFCAAKPQKSDLQPVEHTKCAVLERLVMGKAFCALLGQSKKAFPVFNKTQENLERVKPEAD